MDIKRNMQHLLFQKFLDKTLATVLSVWFLARPDPTEAQEAGSLAARRSPCVRRDDVRPCCWKPLLATFGNSVGSGVGNLRLGALCRIR